MTGTAGTKLTFKVAPGSTGCGDEGGQIFSITGKAIVVKGTGKLAKAKGTLKFTGVYDRGAGTFTRQVHRAPDGPGRLGPNGLRSKP